MGFILRRERIKTESLCQILIREVNAIYPRLLADIEFEGETLNDYLIKIICVRANMYLYWGVTKLLPFEASLRRPLKRPALLVFRL